jgi:hypothetical protein
VSSFPVHRTCSLLGRLGLTAVCAAFLPGCGGGPRAPALQDDPVYQNDQEGFRFLAPPDWTQHAKAAVPSGPVTKERMLVQYKRLRGGKGALLEISLVDLPTSTDLQKYLAGPAFGANHWLLAAPVEKLEVDSVAADRLIFQARVEKAEMTKEVVAFRRGERVYFFTGIFAAGDKTAREQVRRAVGSTVWK